MEISKAISLRKSTRAFLTQPVTKEVITAILEVARYAPSGANTQPWQVVVISKNYIQKIGDSITKVRAQSISPNPDYQYYPHTWYEPYQTRRKKCALALYSSVNITKDDHEKRNAQWGKNYYFFGAPIGLLFFLDQKLEKGSWVDIGMFIQNIMLAAKDYDLDTCPQASIAEYPDLVRNIVNISQDKMLVCGMALGYADTTHPINQYKTERESVTNFTKFLGF